MNTTVQRAIHQIPPLPSSEKEYVPSFPGNQTQDPIQAWHQMQTQRLKLLFISFFARRLCTVVFTLSVSLALLDVKNSGLKSSC